MTNDQLQYLFERYFSKTANPQERDELKEFLNAQTDQQVIFNLMNSSWNTYENSGTQVFTAEEHARILQNILSQADKEEPAPDIVHRVHFLKTDWFRYAAAIILIFGTVVYLYNKTQKEKPLLVTVTQPVPVKEIMPGGQRAVLTLADGSTIYLDSAANGQLAEQAGSIVTKKDGEVVYDGGQVHSKGVVYNTMSTPKGGQYQLTLSDGTKVWLNAASSITYPTQFIERARSVTVQGEAYFEVMKNAKQPFIVNTDKEKIEVLGTSFNVNSYADEPATKISLAEGSVKVNNSILQPGKAYINGKVITTDISQDIAWKNGIFNFNKLPLDQVLKQISRWYDIDIKYEKGIPDVVFIGKVQRNLSLSQVLNVLSKMEVNFRLEGRQLIVLP